MKFTGDKVGKKIEKYVFERLLGKGSYGEVYLARSMEDKKEYAVKCLDKKVKERTDD